MIITISGEAGSGKSTCARGLASEFHLKHYSVGDLMRLLALEKNIKLEEMSKIAEESSEIDKELDNRQIQLGKKEDNFIIDGRMSAYFIPQAIKIFLTADLEERAKRIYMAKRSLEPSSSVEEAKSKIIRRKESEIKRYMSWYDFNPYDPGVYDIVYDSTGKSVETMIHEIGHGISNLKN